MSPYVTELLGPLLVGRNDIALWQPLENEAAFWIAVILLAALLIWVRPRFLSRARRVFRAFSRRKWQSVLAVALLAISLRVAMLRFVPIPEPSVHDEFSYLLGGKTLAAGRLTNPPHPMWTHFESFHINMVTTYQSMYPPGQAVFLALGQRVFSCPWLGVLLSTALMCGTVCWMLQGWMPPQWALAGGILCVLRFATFSFWTNGYWGGAVAALGGAMVYGAYARLRHKPTPVLAAVFCTGLMVLANSRPYEGFLVSLPAVIGVSWMLLRQLSTSTTARRSAAVSALILAAGIGGMAYYNWRGTGHATEMPYMANHRQYHISKMFLWQERLPVPAFRHAIMRKVYVHELAAHMQSRDWDGLRELLLLKLGSYYATGLWPLLGLAIPAIIAMCHSRRVRVLAIASLLLFAGLMIISWPPQAQYMAPGVCLIFAILAYGLRRLMTFRPWGFAFGAAMAEAVLLLLAGWMVVRAGQEMLDPYHLAYATDRMPFYMDRARLQHQFETDGSKHLVIVQEGLSHPGAQEWVYNEPDIDGSKVVWARDMGAPANDELIRYFADRKTWLVAPDAPAVRALPYPPQKTRP